MAPHGTAQRRALAQALRDTDRSAGRYKFRRRGNASRGTDIHRGDNQTVIRYRIDPVPNTSATMNRGNQVVIGHATVHVRLDELYARELGNPRRLVQDWFG